MFEAMLAAATGVERDGDEYEEVAIDHLGARAREALIDDLSHRQRNREKWINR